MQHLMYKDSTTHFIDTGATLQSSGISVDQCQLKVISCSDSRVST
uniref:Uncharacterized protein n=1 Tax=Anguilla anguilla TaxID=7936 RepID=A0A0E9RTS2_ANGAN